MENKKNYVIIGVVAIFLIITLLTVSYAFFNYTRTGDTNTLRMAYIDFDFTDGASVSKGNVFPITAADIDNTITKSFTITAHTELENGISYKVYVIYGDAESGKTRLRDDVISFQYTPPADGNGFTTTVNNYSSPASLSFSGDKALIASGLVKNTTDLTTKTFTVNLWIDSSKINVSSTTKREINAEGNPSLADVTSGTTTATRYMTNDTSESSTITLYPAISSQEGKIIYTTNEFSNSYYSFKILVEAEEGVPPIICKRVTSAAQLNTETCDQASNYCYADGYYAEGSEGTSTITYGTAKDIGAVSGLETGDAFDCDVDGTGYNKRFYYVSDRWNPGIDINDFDTNTAVLIYSSNTLNGVASTSGAGYGSDNWHGPVSVVQHLPSTWGNVSLKQTSRMVYSCNNANCTNGPVTTTESGNNTIENPFNYSNSSTRLLTLPEVIKGCKSVNGNETLTNLGSLKECNFLFEGTKYYLNSNSLPNGIWLESPASNTNGIWYAVAYSRRPDYLSASSTFGVRPVIEVPKSQMQY